MFLFLLIFDIAAALFDVSTLATVVVVVVVSADGMGVLIDADDLLVEIQTCHLGELTHFARPYQFI